MGRTWPGVEILTCAVFPPILAIRKCKAGTRPPIAHKGTVAGAKAVAMTILDIATTPKLVADAKAWFRDVQLKEQAYDPLIAPTDMPAIDRNTRTMAQIRPTMEKQYYQPDKYDSYLQQLGIDYENPDRETPGEEK